MSRLVRSALATGVGAVLALGAAATVLRAKPLTLGHYIIEISTDVTG